MRKAGNEANARKAAQRATEVAPVIAELQAAGATGLRAIAAKLNEQGIPTARGHSDHIRSVAYVKIIGFMW